MPTAVVPETRDTSSLVEHVVYPLRIGVEHLKTSLGRVVSACEIGFGTGAGGPVLVLGVLGMAIPFIRRRVFAIRWATDEDVPEFLLRLGADASRVIGEILASLLQSVDVCKGAMK